MGVLIRRRSALSQGEIEQIDEAKKRELGMQPLGKRDFSNGIFFLLEEGGKLLAVGGLIIVEPVLFGGESYSLLGVGGILAAEKGRGYGGSVVRAIREYLEEKEKTGLGFCKIHNRGFYEKCGFSVNEEAIKRFVYHEGNRKVTNTTDDLVIYIDGKDNFMEKVLENRSGEVILPRMPDW